MGRRYLVLGTSEHFFSYVDYRLSTVDAPRIPPSLNLVLLSNLGRCGSTLLTAMFEDMSKTVAVSGKKKQSRSYLSIATFRIETRNSVNLRISALKGCLCHQSLYLLKLIFSKYLVTLQYKNSMISARLRLYKSFLSLQKTPKWPFCPVTIT